jgi:hypothetical protein
MVAYKISKEDLFRINGKKIKRKYLHIIPTKKKKMTKILIYRVTCIAKIKK